MKEIKAIIQPFMLSKVVSSLKELQGLPGVTVFDVRGFGRQRATGTPAAVLEGMVSYVEKVQLETVVPDDLVEEVIQTIRSAAHTGNPGDGKIFVRTVDDVLRISTSERGETAL
jgi:nitrogen regulatory protein P-II 1